MILKSADPDDYGYYSYRYRTIRHGIRQPT